MKNAKDARAKGPGGPGIERSALASPREWLDRYASQDKLGTEPAYMKEMRAELNKDEYCLTNVEWQQVAQEAIRRFLEGRSTGSIAQVARDILGERRPKVAPVDRAAFADARRRIESLVVSQAQEEAAAATGLATASKRGREQWDEGSEELTDAEQARFRQAAIHAQWLAEQFAAHARLLQCHDFTKEEREVVADIVTRVRHSRWSELPLPEADTNTARLEYWVKCIGEAAAKCRSLAQDRNRRNTHPRPFATLDETTRRLLDECADQCTQEVMERYPDDAEGIAREWLLRALECWHDSKKGPKGTAHGKYDCAARAILDTATGKAVKPNAAPRDRLVSIAEQLEGIRKKLRADVRARGGNPRKGAKLLPNK